MTAAEEAIDELYMEDGWLYGNAFEAFVSCHASPNVACFHCKGLRTLCWTGGHLSSWRDMTCRLCHSTYEIKAKKDLAAIDKIFRYNTVYGGSFRGWCIEQKKSENTDAKHFLVLVSRAASYVRSGRRMWVVEITEIDRVLPRLSFKSFSTFFRKRKNILLSSTCFVKERIKWFQIPHTPTDIGELFQTEYEKIFPGAWKRLLEGSETSSEADNDGNGTTAEGGKDEHDGEEKDDQLERLRRELEELRTGDGEDWESNFD